jgi:hypothetical protein
MKLDRRTFLGLGVLALVAPSTARAEDVVVPVTLQAELLAKVAAYDRNFAARAGERARVLILTKGSNAQSARVGSQVQSALAGLGDVAGLPHTEVVSAYSGAADLAAACKSKGYAIVYLTPGFDAEVAAIAKALAGISVLTVSAIPGYVPLGMVLGFDTVSGKSKLLVNLTQARLQSVSFKAEILKLMKVFE